jgi:hypothetical protein
VPFYPFIRKDIMEAYTEERKKALSYMASTKSRVSITTDLWTSDNQRRGYMAITAHFIDDSWVLRNIIMRYCCCSNYSIAAIIFDQKLNLSTAAIIFAGSYMSLLHTQLKLSVKCSMMHWWNGIWMKRSQL